MGSRRGSEKGRTSLTLVLLTPQIRLPGCSQAGRLAGSAAPAPPPAPHPVPAYPSTAPAPQAQRRWWQAIFPPHPTASAEQTRTWPRPSPWPCAITAPESEAAGGHPARAPHGWDRIPALRGLLIHRSRGPDVGEQLLSRGDLVNSREAFETRAQGGLRGHVPTLDTSTAAGLLPPLPPTVLWRSLPLPPLQPRSLREYFVTPRSSPPSNGPTPPAGAQLGVPTWL